MLLSSSLPTLPMVMMQSVKAFSWHHHPPQQFFEPKFLYCACIFNCNNATNNMIQTIGFKRPYQMKKKGVLRCHATLVDFPRDYDELLKQAEDATKEALKNGKKLMEVEFPTAGLESVSGDAEGGIEMTRSMVLVRDFCCGFLENEKYARTRIFFPDMSEVARAKAEVFEGTFFKLDYLTKPSGLGDLGFTEKLAMADRLKPNDEMVVVAYPYFNVNEMLAVEDLYTNATTKSKIPILVFNGELDRIRSGYYPSFFYPKLGALCKNFLPKFETVYYIHNFKGRHGGTLFRAYPGPWQVLQKIGDAHRCILQRETMPSLKEVALDILPRA